MPRFDKRVAIRTPTLVEIAQEAPYCTLADLDDVQHPVNNTSESGKRKGMSIMIDGDIYVAQGRNPADPWVLIAMNGDIPVIYALNALSTDTVILSTDASNPSYITGISLSESSPELEAFDPVGGWIRNNGTEPISMAGTVTLQTQQGVGGSSVVHLWSERSTDNGTTSTVNPQSLRMIDVGNDSASSHTKSSAISQLLPGESVRFAMYITGGATTLAAPSATVNGTETVEGLSFFWTLN